MAFPTKVRSMLLLLASWRLISVYVVQTSHVPDEYWQSLEVAHRLAFGYGHLTWEWRSKIRSYIYPFLVSILYRILALLNLDYPILLINLPRIFQALLSSYADYRFYLWTKSERALFALCANWFWYYCASRTLTNSVETALTGIALSAFPWPDRPSADTKFLWIVGFVTAVRPTAAVLWIPLCVYHLFTSSKKLRDFSSYCVTALVTVTYSILIDSLCYGSFVVTPWEFFRANVLNDIGCFYGVHNFLWYIYAGLPVLVGPQIVVLPIAVFEAFRNMTSNKRQMLITVAICWTVFVYSMLSHKEFRFVLPLLPMLIHLCTVNLPCVFGITEFRRKIFSYLFLVFNLLPGLYVCLIHQRGSLDVMNLLRDEFGAPNSTNKTLLFLTPCHATPLYSHLHVNVTTRFLTCEPNMNGSLDYVDEADEFFENPMTWIDNNIPTKDNVGPDLLVLFDNLTPKIAPFLKNYHLAANVFHAHFPQPNYGNYIELYRRK